MKLDITVENLKPVSEKLVARMNQLGLVSKTGNPVVVDQAFELVSALFGRRNQHVFRKALTSEAKCSCCIAKPIPAVDDAMIAALETLGYSVRLSDFKRPYWAFGDDASEDFNTEAEAWKAALTDALARGRIAAGAPVQVDFHAAMRQTMEDLEQRWGHEHGWYTREDWRIDVRDDNTRLGYWEWVAHNIESHGGEEEHCDSCGKELDGDGWDGKCGDCADANCVDNHCTECGEYTRECRCDESTEQSQPGVGAANAASAERDTQAAEESYDAFDFQAVLGDNFRVAASNSWEPCTHLVGGKIVKRSFSRTVFIEDLEKPDEDTKKVRFSVEVIDGVAQNPRVNG
ncbi:hypothetical protein AB4Y45_35620 [Paraburkholderia sp. EG287A]|uniref:hypothetical protein n=1 Tax=Paraburkholderia sp. EG287A TaxID=3237012 RepID=UPI0034D2E6D6